MSQDSTAQPESDSTDTEVTAADAWTIKRLLEWTTGYFEQHNPDAPRLAAEILLAKAVGCQRIELYTRFNEVPEDEPVAAFRCWLQRHAAGEPVAYLVGHKEFYSLQFNVNQNVLIPRPETEHVVVAAIECAKKIDASPVRIVDVGTGSGCVVIALARHVDSAEFVAIDISDDALNVARENAALNDVQGRIEFLSGDLLEGFDQPVHIIVSNPPYIGTEEQGTVDEHVRQYEPEVALFSGSDGLAATSRLIEQSGGKLEPGGFLIFETSPFIVDRCVELINASGSLEFVESIKDPGGHRRVVVAKKS